MKNSRFMNKKISTLLSALLLLCLLARSGAQAQPVCGFDAIHHKLLATSPAYARNVELQEIAILKTLQANTASTRRPVINGADTVYEIPVVIHVMHTGSAVGTNYNPSDAQLLGMIDYLNQSFAANWPGYALAGAGGTRIPLRFVLAQRTPGCAASSGIDRVNASTLVGYSANGVQQETATGVADSALKSLALWPPNQYYNIWVVNKIDGVDGYPGTVGAFIAGYAMFAGSPPYVDGTVMLASQATSGQKTLPHEIGHAFNLYHTFEGANGSNCPANANCQLQGDRICDTDPTNEAAFFTCPTGNNPCTNQPWNNQQTNFMHYTSCADQRFTPGQRDRVMAALLTTRPGLNTSAALTPPPAVTITAATCSPANITNVNNQAGAGPVKIKLNTLEDSSLSYSHTHKFYEDNTCNLGTTLVADQTGYTLSVFTMLNPQTVKAYIDYNDDGAFSAAEQVLNSTTPAGQANNAYYHTAAVVAPNTAIKNKPLRMRIIADINNPTANACSNLNYGQTEDYYVIVLPDVNLPIRIYAEQIATKDNVVTFSFKAAEQEKVRSYKLQRAAPDMIFRTIQEFPAGVQTQYTLQDAPLQAGTYYYRILATESDGSSYFSRTLGAVTGAGHNAAGSLLLYPNPAQERFEIRLPRQPQTNIHVVVTDVYGKKIMEQAFSPQAVLQIQHRFAPGVYVLSVYADNQQWTQKLVIKP